MFALLEVFQSKYSYKDIGGSRVNDEQHPQTQDQKAILLSKQIVCVTF